MNLVCHVILQDHVIKGQVILWVGPPYVSHHSATSTGHRHCGSGDMFLVAKKENSRCFCSIAVTVYELKAHGISYQ